MICIQTFFFVLFRYSQKTKQKDRIYSNEQLLNSLKDQAYLIMPQLCNQTPLSPVVHFWGTLSGTCLHTSALWWYRNCLPFNNMSHRYLHNIRQTVECLTSCVFSQNLRPRASFFALQSFISVHDTWVSTSYDTFMPVRHNLCLIFADGNKKTSYRSIC